MRGEEIPVTRDDITSRYRLDEDTGCWHWTGALNRHIGYGYFRQKIAHRLSYELLVGPIPDGYQIDHLCRVRDCINPDHLEAVTPEENNRRSDSWSAVKMRQTECHNGHPLSGDNLKITTRGSRQCRECRRNYKREWYREKRAKEREARALVRTA
ncbi:HNH endonuclease signature motif containing protein [Oerskovia enterophila]|uniref:HNH endonuclease signature motif containing protein n=1 Tax=Oerskovia enterophila TaxID=43678 RepID=UPI00382274CC